ncbi:MAG: nucleoside-diphosphate kinase [Candidatus Melainabacteria bacterium RIFCSPHIGHO2_02_FULL_34_12]|nr:MAG: nucleoside-diphosphate kinase [Candidatus Melainabacteria bacterium RIFCSPHIGHO2_02_FULL_34_12]
MEKTFLAIKPDGIQRGLIGKIISRLEEKGFKLVAMKFMLVSNELAQKHYGEHKEKPFFKGLVDFITSGPVVAMIWEGKDVINALRKMMGKTNPLEADTGTIRGDFGVDIGRNVVHGSDSAESAKREIKLFFNESEIISWQPEIQKWIYE